MSTSRQLLLALGLILAAVAVAAVTDAVAEEPAPASAAADGVVAYYFHGNVRCATCRKIEAYADEAIHSAFPAELESGTLAWSAVNIDEPDDKHFIEDFQLVTRSVVLAEYRGGEVVRYTNLDKVWQLVRDEAAFIAYVQDETRTFLGLG